MPTTTSSEHTDPSAPLWRLGVQALTQGYAEGRFTPADALQAVLQRLQAVQPTLNPVATLDAERALQAAQASTQRWQAGAPRSALDGVPVSVKDSLVTGGLRTTWGSRVFEQQVPVDDELPVARLRQAGALLFAKTNVPEFTVQGYTDNGLFGTTRNPWNPALTPGGSSGGAVCAVASGVGPLALATDGGGSIRRPAGHCGLVGLKPTTGRIPRHGGLPEILLHFEVVGPIGRTVADVATMLDVLAGPDRRDAASLHLPPARAARGAAAAARAAPAPGGRRAGGPGDRHRGGRGGAPLRRAGPRGAHAGPLRPAGGDQPGRVAGA
ncbi:amidase [Aquabacterium sp. J223]|uniref:amidase n=1 Tax=Aquabacterium sp. J223 TaxID=2898431 RepID=UPI0021AE2876|nr:amidase [Aquabacterium sp. J223]